MDSSPCFWPNQNRVRGPELSKQTVGPSDKESSDRHANIAGAGASLVEAFPEQGYNVAAPYARLRIVGRLNGVYLIGLLQ